MNAYETANALGITGTDEEIVTALTSTGVTASKIDLSYLMELLNFRGMLRKTDGAGGQERWVGTLQNLKAALIALGQTESVTAYETWFSHVTNPRQTHWDTTQVAYAAGFWAMRQAFADGENMPSSADFAAVAGLGGGWKFATLTVEEFATHRDAAIASQAAEAEEETKRQKQSYLAEANDAAIHAIADDADITQTELLAAFTARLVQEWPE